HEDRDAATGVPPAALRGGRVALEQRVFSLGVECGRRLVEDEQQRLLAHETARERELLPLTERQLRAAGPRWTELCFEARRQPADHVAGARALDRRRDRT